MGFAEQGASSSWRKGRQREKPLICLRNFKALQILIQALRVMIQVLMECWCLTTIDPAGQNEAFRLASRLLAGSGAPPCMARKAMK
ncbi:MAG: hypothetical protein BGP09_33905 [Rhizobium sp. 60-20]|nr:MAG: hypothetical protein BGP09_33905 [Rhizobium sp. 60-20]